MAAYEIKDADISRGCRQNNPGAWGHLIRTYTPLVLQVVDFTANAPGQAGSRRRESGGIYEGFTVHHNP